MKLQRRDLLGTMNLEVLGVLVQAMAPPGGQELILGVTQDPALGPLLTLGFGGAAAEIYRDVLSEVLPLSHAVAHELLESLTGAPLLKGFRGRPPADVEAWWTPFAEWRVPSVRPAAI